MPMLVESAVASRRPHPCFAADSAMECDSHARWRLLTRTGACFACDRHVRLIEIRLERAGLAPHRERLDGAEAELARPAVVH